ncbi:MAG: hypothetical protein ACI8RD_012899 [Bacillariaceae sp.]
MISIPSKEEKKCSNFPLIILQRAANTKPYEVHSISVKYGKMSVDVYYTAMGCNNICGGFFVG